MNPDLLLPIAARWAHVLSAIIAVGGAFFMRMVLLPAANAALNEDAHAHLRAHVMPRWRRIIHICVALFLLSGFYNYLAVTGPRHPDQPLYHALFGVKFLLALAVFALAIALTSSKPYAERMRAQSKKWMTILVALAIAVVLISGVMKNVPPASAPPPVAAENGN